MHPDWAPNGAARFLELVRDKYFDGSALFRAIPNFLVQFGIAKEESKRKKWQGETIQDDPQRPDIPIEVGTMAFAGSGADSRSTQVWIALTDADKNLGTRSWETPFGKLIGDLSYENLHKIFSDYGDKVDQSRIWNEGYAYLDHEFPKLDHVSECWVDEFGAQAPVVLEDERRPKRNAEAGSSLAPLTLVAFLSLVLIMLCRKTGKKANAKMWGMEPVKEV